MCFKTLLSRALCSDLWQPRPTRARWWLYLHPRWCEITRSQVPSIRQQIVSVGLSALAWALQRGRGLTQKSEGNRSSTLIRAGVLLKICAQCQVAMFDWEQPNVATSVAAESKNQGHWIKLFSPVWSWYKQNWGQTFQPLCYQMRIKSKYWNSIMNTLTWTMWLSFSI